MIKPIIIVFLLLFYIPTLKANKSNVWSLFKNSKNNHYRVNLQCDHSPTLTGFQDCRLILSSKLKQINNANILLEGGMPKHHHGLPTAPKISWDNVNNYYNINGLKFSMPGAWQLTFLIDKTENLPRDLATINFIID